MERIEKIQQFQPIIDQFYAEVGKKVIGQKTMIRDIFISLLSRGHILIEGAPGLAKTLTIDTISKTLHLENKRIQFTPDLLPSDLIGVQIYNPAKHDFGVKFGPIFSNFILADEINRAPSKVQSALLEAMAEKQVSIGDTTYKLPSPFMVLATQNPIEQEGTFLLPEAQLDRFLLKTVVDYPTPEEEKNIMKFSVERKSISIQPIFNAEDIFEMQECVDEIYVDEKIYQYISDIVFFTREKRENIGKYMNFPVSPRASLALLQSAKALAFLSKRDFVLPEDVKEMAYPVLRHRISLNYEAYADNITSEHIITTILQHIEII